ncbi:Hypothetical predicted protein [Mytilus galloprovincialis]|uniref:Uncharacterized protein n=1 Tax=Mytilus galloprovincialis TaxID=29158 RepID=A0A8B6D3T1_MYTGA|nr:Hypothetical predicted protein [Mytilus galloprovincialis]
MAVPEKWAVMCLDFAENFTCLWQDEVQGAHWSYDQVTLHPIVSYYNCPKENCKNIVEESIMICFDRKCVQCGTSQINEKLVFLEDYSNDNIKWSAWERTKYKNAAGTESLRMMKIPKEEKLNNFLSILKVKLEPFAKHIFDAKWQAQQFKKITMAVPEKWAVMCLDFAENFTCLWQDEAQGAHWSYDQVTLHPIVSYYNCPKENCKNIVEESIMFVRPTARRHKNPVKKS